MTTAKAWRQKGTGRARAGALSVAPPPRRRRRLRPQAAQLHGQGQPQGAPPGAARRASVHAARGSIAVLDGSAFDEPSTKQAAEALAKWDARPPTLVVLGAEEAAAREELSQHRTASPCCRPTAVGVADVIGAASLVVSEAALERCARESRRQRRGGPVMDARQVIIEPVVSEKSYALMADGKYTFRVDDRAHKTQIRARGRGDLRRPGGRACAPPRCARSRSAAACTPARTRSLEEGDRRSSRPGDRIELFEGAAVAE